MTHGKTHGTLATVRLIEVSAYCRFILQKIRVEKLDFNEAGVRLIQVSLLHVVPHPPFHRKEKECLVTGMVGKLVWIT